MDVDKIREKMISKKRPTSAPKTNYQKQHRRTEKEIVNFMPSSSELAILLGTDSVTDLKEVKSILESLEAYNNHYTNHLLERRKSASSRFDGGGVKKNIIFNQYPTTREILYSSFSREMILLLQHKYRRQLCVDVKMKGIDPYSASYVLKCREEDDVLYIPSKEEIDSFFAKNRRLERIVSFFIDYRFIDENIPSFLKMKRTTELDSPITEERDLRKNSFETKKIALQNSFAGRRQSNLFNKDSERLKEAKNKNNIRALLNRKAKKKGTLMVERILKSDTKSRLASDLIEQAELKIGKVNREDRTRQLSRISSKHEKSEISIVEEPTNNRMPDIMLNGQHEDDFPL